MWSGYGAEIAFSFACEDGLVTDRRETDEVNLVRIVGRAARVVLR